jgi:hypothetical protein
VLNAVHRAIDRGDLLTLSLVDDLPFRLRDGRHPHATALPRLGEYGIAVGAVESLTHIARAGIDASTPFPPAWLRVILEVESGEIPRDLVVDVLDACLEREGSDSGHVADLLHRHPTMVARLNCPQVPF